MERKQDEAIHHVQTHAHEKRPHLPLLAEVPEEYEQASDETIDDQAENGSRSA